MARSVSLVTRPPDAEKPPVFPFAAVTAVATPTNNNRPSVTFTVTGATTIQCQVDAGTFAACSSPFTPATALADGSHTITVRATDAVGNVGTGSTTFTVDTAPPSVVFDDTPPARWPVNYFDMRFHSTDGTATFACSLNGAAFTACANPFTITTVYNTQSTFVVRATDPAGNSSTASTSWTSSNGLVLHYPWEHGLTQNTSLLVQKPAYSPDGSVALTEVGGWAGSGISAPGAHQYPTTIRALSSSADGTYTMSIWARLGGNPTGTVLSTMASNTTNGFALSISGRTVTLQVKDAGTVLATNAVVLQNQWVQLGVLATTTANGSVVQLLINGSVASTLSPRTTNGFGPGQAANLTVGPISGVDLDDLRFYNRGLATSELCTTLVRGQIVAGSCVPLVPRLELDFEHNQIIDTGTCALPLTAPALSTVAFVSTGLGTGVQFVAIPQGFSYSSGFTNCASQAPGHSLSGWFMSRPTNDGTDTLFDSLQFCGTQGNLCGLDVEIADSELTLFVGDDTPNLPAITIQISNGFHSFLITEQKVPGTTITQSLSIYVDGDLTVMPLGTGNVFGEPRDFVNLGREVGMILDEIEFWPRDLSADPEMLCENGLDGHWDPVSTSCLFN